MTKQELFECIASMTDDERRELQRLILIETVRSEWPKGMSRVEANAFFWQSLTPEQAEEAKRMSYC